MNRRERRVHDVGTIAIELGSRGRLTEHYAREAAGTFRQIRSHHPRVPIALSIGGYDDDPRELWQVPEVCRFVQWWARFAGISDWPVAVTIPWKRSDRDLFWLAQCGAFGDDHPFPR
jgi:hypothetical protein